MSNDVLKAYFQSLIKRVEESDIGNNGKDKNGFFKPTRALLLRKLHLLEDLHMKPMARAMVIDAWQSIAEELPPEWLILGPEEKMAMQKILQEKI